MWPWVSVGNSLNADASDPGGCYGFADSPDRGGVCFRGATTSAFVSSCNSCLSGSLSQSWGNLASLRRPVGHSKHSQPSLYSPRKSSAAVLGWMAELMTAHTFHGVPSSSTTSLTAIVHSPGIQTASCQGKARAVGPIVLATRECVKV